MKETGPVIEILCVLVLVRIQTPLIVCDVLFIRKNVTHSYGDILYST